MLLIATHRSAACGILCPLLYLQSLLYQLMDRRIVGIIDCRRGIIKVQAGIIEESRFIPRCVAPVDVLSLPKREFNLLAANLPELRQSFEGVMEQRGSAATHAG